MNDIKSYDGFYFNPTKEDDGVEFSYFKFNEDKDRGEKIEGSEIGDKYHIIILKPSESGVPYIDDNFEAILVEPTTYIEHLTNCNVEFFGVIVRKTTKSFKFVEYYLTNVIDAINNAIEKFNHMEK